jgi:hypothetical protein
MILAIMAKAAHADVLDADHNGFTIRYSTQVDSDRLAVYVAAVQDVGKWWNPDHTMSGNAANMSLQTDMPGCLCETLGQGAGLVHMTVTFANPGVMLRLTGGLGPLGLMGVAGNMTWEFDEDEALPDVTTVTLQYAVGGYMNGGLDQVAPAVDGVLVEAVDRLKRYVETGSPVAAE